MKMRQAFSVSPKAYPLTALRLAVASLLFGGLAGFAQTGQYLFTGSLTNITLGPGNYDIAAYGAQGGGFYNYYPGGGSLGAEMKARFSFATAVNLTLLVGGAGGGGGGDYSISGGGCGGGGSFVVNGSTPLVIAGGGGGAGYYNVGGNGNVVTNGGDGGQGGAGGSAGSGGSPAGGFYYGAGGGGYSGDGGGDGLNLGGSGGSSFLHGGAGGAGNYAGSGGYGGGGGGGVNFTFSGGSYSSLPSGGGGGGGYSGGGGGTGADNHYFDGGGGGGSIIDSSAVTVITQVSGVASPDNSPHGEIIISVAPPPITLSLASLAGGQYGFNITGPTNAAVVVAACTDLANPVWIPLATNTLNNGTNYFRDARWTNYACRFYRVSGP